MNFKQLLAGFEAAVPAVGQVVAAMHPENALEGAKIAAGVQLFQFLAAGLHQIATASAAAGAPATPAQTAATPASPAPIAVADPVQAAPVPSLSLLGGSAS